MKKIDAIENKIRRKLGGQQEGKKGRGKGNEER